MKRFFPTPPVHFRPPHAARLNKTYLPSYSMRRSLRHGQTLFWDIDIFDPTYLPERLSYRDARNVPSSSIPPSGGFREMPSSAAPWGPGRPQRSGGSLPGLRRPPGRLSRSTSTAGRTTLPAVYRYIEGSLPRLPLPLALPRRDPGWDRCPPQRKECNPSHLPRRRKLPHRGRYLQHPPLPPPPAL